ncbi:MAG TPA: MFS transporter [Methylomirabilota bacterium]|jgi:MFS family permease|nr:MFS transporter [Methylomirabilota bacterium]
MRGLVARNNPFKTPAAARLAVLFAVVYFSQGMYHVADQVLTLTLKERLGLSASQVGAFGTITLVPWVIKPLYGIVSDAFPLFGRRRKSYFVITCALATAACLGLAAATPTYGALAALLTVMGLGFAFTDVLTDAMMVENGKPLRLTGAFQSVQWAAINGATILVGLVGGYLAERRNLGGAFLVAACFPFIALVMGAAFIHEPPAKSQREEFREAWTGIKRALRDRNLWVVAGFIFFWTFSPSIGIPLFYYQTDTLKFSQQFIGLLGSLTAGAAIVGAAVYAPLSRRASLHRLILFSIAVSVIGTLAYLLYNDWRSALVIDTVFGGVGMITQLAFLDLAAKACPKHAEGTFFALLMSVYNLGVQGSQVTGGYLFDVIGYTPLVLISAIMTGVTYLLLPLVNIPEIERRARADGPPPELAPIAS